MKFLKLQTQPVMFLLGGGCSCAFQRYVLHFSFQVTKLCFVFKEYLSIQAEFHFFLITQI